MKLLTLLHRWTGGIVGLILAVLGLSGTALLWEEAWISLPGADVPATGSTAELARAVEVAASNGRELSRITFGDEGMALHLAIYEDGGGAYIDQAGRVIDSWGSVWGRPELWLFDLHHHLLIGHTGETISGVLGLLLLGFVITGAILWWRTRKSFAFRVWPKRMSRSAIIRQHRDIGVVASPLLLVTALTGSLMIFSSLSDALLAPWAGEAGPEEAEYAVGSSAEPNFAALMTAGQAAFPEARPRRLQLPSEPGEPALLRLRQDFEWTPNGRSYAYLDPATGKLAGTEDPAQSDMRSAIQEKFYPVHSAKVGGLLWQLLLTFSGLTLVLLGTLASWSFWFRKGDGKPKPARSAPLAAPQPAE